MRKKAIKTNYWKRALFWLIAFLITIGSAIYQRKTGPTYPKNFQISVSGNSYSFELPRAQAGFTDAKISLEIADPRITGNVTFRRYPTNEPFDTLSLQRENENLVAWLPKQPSAGKLEYKVALFFEGEPLPIDGNDAVIIRYRGDVPALILIPHIIFIFAAMLLANLTGIYTLASIASYRFYTALTLILFLLGGMIMGPLVQKYAFGEFWTGFPLGMDLTDNKALVAFLFWIAAWLGNRKGKERKYLVIIATIITLVIFLIPHSMMGSELDPSTGEIKTGSLAFLMLLFIPGRKQ
jgi:hypothetical protein